LSASLILAIVAVTTLTPALADPSPSPSDVQAQIDAQLKAYPGGVQISPTEVSYDNGRFVMTFVQAEPAVAGSADCPFGWFCFYDNRNYGYPRGKLSDCGWQDLAVWGWQDRTESVHYNMSSGSVAFINHVPTPWEHAYDEFAFGVGTSLPHLSDTSPYRNTVDHVERFC
jgi:hypothetical protein